MEAAAAEDVSEFYDHHRFSLAVSLIRRFSAESLKRWLDIGCHNGSFARLLVAHGFNVTGSDVWDPSLMRDTTWQYRQQKDSRIPFEDGKADIVSALEVIEHIIDTDDFLEEVRRVLSPDGLMVLSTPNINMLRNRWRVPFGRYPHGPEWRTVIHHVRMYNVEKMREHLTQHGFRVLYVRGVHLLPTRFCRVPLGETVSNALAELLPTLCSNMVVVAARGQ
jgi:2-polyprenyl-3-methyl-5-hydroxy-6-metoxy-1,4-benzoquinol methylase